MKYEIYNKGKSIRENRDRSFANVEGEFMTDMKKYISRLFEISEDRIREEMESCWESFDIVMRRKANNPERPIERLVIRNCIDSRADEFTGMITGMTKTLFSALVASGLSRDESSYYFDLAHAKSLALRKNVDLERDKRMNNVDMYYDSNKKRNESHETE